MIIIKRLLEFQKFFLKETIVYNYNMIFLLIISICYAPAMSYFFDEGYFQI